MLPRIASLGRVKGKTANQLRFESVGQFAGLLHVAGQVLVERHVSVFRAVLDVHQFDLADRRTDRRDIQPIFVLELADLLDLGHAQLHDVLHTLADVDEADAVVLQPQGGESYELLQGGLVVGRFVGKTRENDSRCLIHRVYPAVGLVRVQGNLRDRPASTDGPARPSLDRKVTRSW